MVLYFPLRSFAGGFHSRTRLGCYITSVVLMSAALLSIRYLTLSLPVYMLVMFPTALALYILAPVEDANKPLDQIEIRVYRKRARTIVFLEGIIFIVCLIAEAPQAANCALLSLITAAALVIAGKKHK
jgi:accessory gene regulator B